MKSDLYVLAYHRVNDIRDDILSVSTKRFREQISFFKSQGYRSIALQEAMTKKPEERNIVITFDDGYQDNYHCAWPILKEFGFTATIFVTAGYVDEKKQFAWNDNPVTPQELDYCLTREQIKTLTSEGVEIGSHTITHPFLAELPLDLAKEEIQGSKSMLEDIIEQPLFSFCYPSGSFNDEVRNLVATAGFKAAVVTPGSNTGKVSPGDPYTIQRVGIYRDDNLQSMRLKLSSFWRLASRTSLGGSIRKLRRLIAN
jgi:peptidoglycan/xylan/chitin deacetylase (PgdA/CDA1 family)